MITFGLENFDQVWMLLVQVGLLFVALFFGNFLIRVIPFLRKSFIPSALVGGALLLGLNLVVNAIIKKCGGTYQLVDKSIMQVITYHALGLGFVAMTLKVNTSTTKANFGKVIENGAMTGATYMLQAVFGIIATLIIAAILGAFGISIFNGSGLILPLAFGQGPGNALSWDTIFSDKGLMNTNGSFGLSLASIGFIVASIVGVIYINIFKKKGEINPSAKIENRTVETFENRNEIEDSASIDKLSVQVCLVMFGYAGAFGIMCFFRALSKWTGIAMLDSVAWGFNFIWGVISATLLKTIFVKLKEKNIVKHKYINNYQMDRISGLAFDVMIVAGVAAIDFGDVQDYIIPIIVLTIVGTVITLVYVRIITKLRYKDCQHEMFLTNFGTLTGTASNGMILLKEIDPNFETPASKYFVASQLPATIFVAPLLLLLNFASDNDKPYKLFIALAIFAILAILYTVIIFIPKGKKHKNDAVVENLENKQ